MEEEKQINKELEEVSNDNWIIILHCMYYIIKTTMGQIDSTIIILCS